jgi:hypothetical protein
MRPTNAAQHAATAALAFSTAQSARLLPNHASKASTAASQRCPHGPGEKGGLSHCVAQDTFSQEYLWLSID